MFNSSFNVYKTEWLDLVFSNRNKSYGAYALRTQSSSIMTRALFFSGSIFILCFTAPLIYAKFNPAEVISDTGTLVDLSKIYDTKTEVKPKAEDAPKAEPEKEKIKTVKMSGAPVVTDRAIEPAPTITEIQDAVVSDKTQDGEIKPGAVINTSPGNGTGTETIPGDSGADPNAIMNVATVEEYPEFEGGMKAWAKYIQKNLRYPVMAQEAGTQGRVFLSFVVETDGSITNVTLIKGIGSGCDEEAVKVIKKSPAWKPGKNNGRAVRVRYNLPISFTLSNF